MKKTLSAILLALLFIGMLPLAFNIQPVKADYTWSETIYIHGDGSIEPADAPISTVDKVTYTLMDNLVNAAPSTDDIAIIIERDNTILDGAGCTLQGTDVWRSKGIVLSGRSNVTIENMNIRNFYSGVELSHSSDSTVAGNNITDNASGIYLYWSSNFNTVAGNTITDNEYGVWLYLYWSSNFNTVFGNTITNNTYGVWLSESSNSTVAGNTITDNGSGVYLSESSDNMVSGNSITDNGSGVFLYNSSDNMVSGNSITDNGSGVLLYYGSGSVVSGNTITNNTYGSGVWLYESLDSTVAGNTITDNEYGVWLYENSDSVVSGNTIANNVYGVRLYNSSGSTLHHNNFVDNTEQVYDSAWDDIDVPPSINVWDDGYPSGGNYWSGYNGTDTFSGPNQDQSGSDGIRDTPYEIDVNNTDHFPLMEPISSFDAGTWGETSYQVDTVSSSVLSDFDFSQDNKLISFNVTGPNGTVGFCRVTIPNVLLGGPYVVLVNDSPPLTISEWTDGTHTFLYFTYNHSVRPVEIMGTTAIPEFPTWIPLLLLLSVISVTLVIYKQRLLKTPPD